MEKHSKIVTFILSKRLVFMAENSEDAIDVAVDIAKDVFDSELAASDAKGSTPVIDVQDDNGDDEVEVSTPISNTLDFTI